MKRSSFFAAVLSGLLLAGTASAATLPGPMVDAAWLHAHRDGVTVLDVRSWLQGFTAAPKYESKDGERVLVRAGGHIPGALLIDAGKVRAEREVRGKMIAGELPTREAFQVLMRSAGVNAGEAIVIATPGETVGQMDEAARVYWTLKYFGDDDIAILNGGTAAWLAAGYKVSTSAVKAAKGDWVATAERDALLARFQDVKKALADGTQLVDARTVGQYLGVSKKWSVKVAGHLRGAKNMPVAVHTRTQGPAQLFLSADEYRNVFRKLGIQPEAGTITYCNTGHLASGAWFVLSELLGVDDVRLYDGSMLAWTTFGGGDVVGLAE
ncbi:MAG: hypothetical protein L0H19_01715 [Salinisphaera sp.]|nr:hypothetical protein [Salinisphaera sp.]MDN5937085.1 hypothetical protein [Salinisphaera sp.]